MIVADFGTDIFGGQSVGSQSIIGQSIGDHSIGGKRSDERFYGRYLRGLVQEDVSCRVFHQDMHAGIHAGSIKYQSSFAFLYFQVQQSIFRGILYIAHFAVRHEVLHPRLLFVGLQPTEIGLVVSVHAGHQFDVRAVLIGQVTVPCLAEVAVAPCPLFLARRDMMVGHVQQAAAYIFFITAHKVIFGLDGHVRGGHGDILVFGDIHPCRVILLVIDSRSDGERGYITLAVVEHSIDVGREHRVVMVVHHHGGIGPPQEGLRERSAVIDLHLYFDISLARMEREALHPFGAEHPFHFVAPHGLASVGILLYGEIRRKERGGTVMLRPVELDAAGNPRAGESHQCRFHHLVVIDEMTFLHLVVCHVDASAQFGQNHHLDIFVLDEQGMIEFVRLFVRNLLDYRIRVHRTATALIHPLFEEDGVLLLFSYLVGGKQDIFLPCTHFTFVNSALNQILSYLFHHKYWLYNT